MSYDECCGSGCVRCILDEPRVKRSTTNAGRKSVFEPPNYTSFEVSEIVRMTSEGDVYKLTFSLAKGLPRSDQCLGITSGNYLLLRAPKEFDRSWFNQIFAEPEPRERLRDGIVEKLDKHDKESEDIFISRPYTPYLVDEESLSFSILVRLQSGGAMSIYLRTLRLGVVTEWKGPYGQDIDLNGAKFMLGICQGVAIAPLFARMKDKLDDDELRMRLICCFRREKDILLRKELVEMNGFWNFESWIYLAHQDQAEVKAKHTEKLFRGKLDQENIQKVVQGLNPNETVVVLCGCEGFMTSLKQFLDKFNKIYFL